MFNVKAAKESCEDKDNKLTYSQFTKYYNELVVQLKLAEYNLAKCHYYFGSERRTFK